MHHLYLPLSVVALSLGAALCFALSSVLQHRAAVGVPDEHSLRPRMFLRLGRDWRFYAGNGFDGLGFALQFLALRRGSLALVTPLLVTGLLFALPLGALLAKRRLR
ncbi:MAG TPA: DMT family transporter, partial [Acidimicrobiales bacterium]